MIVSSALTAQPGFRKQFSGPLFMNYGLGNMKKGWDLS